MINLVLYQPTIPPNTGNIMRLCTNTGFKLSLIKPLGFDLKDKSLKRAKLDYFINFPPEVFENLESFLSSIILDKLIIITKFGKKKYNNAIFQSDSVILFGSEIIGLPKKFLKTYSDKTYKIPMVKKSRSLNLSNAVSIVAYEAWKNINFSGAAL